MAYAIMRIAKIKTRGKMSSTYRHNERLRETPNADPSKSENNTLIIGNQKESYLQAFDRITEGVKIRANAVLGLEVFLSASPNTEIFRDQEKFNDWIRSSVNWLQETFGKENVVQLHGHMDESTPHLHAFIVPMKDGKLNSKHFIGGHRDRLIQLQTEYAKSVEHLKLDRGILKSKATHQDVKRFYGAVRNELDKELPAPKLLESSKKYKERVEPIYQDSRLKVLHSDMTEDKVKHLQNELSKYRYSGVEKAIQEAKLKEKVKALDKILAAADRDPDLRSKIDNLNQDSKNLGQEHKSNDRDRGMDR
jgi:heme oxygenase